MTEELTIRERVRNIQNEILAGNLVPARASEMLVELASIFGNINDEIRVKDVEYNKILLHHLETEEKANRAKIKAETTEEYIAKRTARDTKDLALELIRSLKYYLKSAEDEFGVGRFQ
jgi:hypothetical protein